MAQPNAEEPFKLPERTPEQIAHAWQDFRKWCVERAIDAKASAADGNIVATAQEIALYIMTKDKLEKPE